MPEPPTLWTICIGPSGATKTPPYRDVEDMAQDINDRLQDDYETDLAEYETQREQWEIAKDSGEDPGENPIAPIQRDFIKSDTTIEALIGVLQDTHHLGQVLDADVGREHAAGDQQLRGPRRQVGPVGHPVLAPRRVSQQKPRRVRGDLQVAEVTDVQFDIGFRHPEFKDMGEWRIRRLMARIRDAARAFAERQGDDAVLAAINRLTRTDEWCGGRAWVAA